MSGNGKNLIGAPGPSAHAILEKAIAEIAKTYAPETLADAGLALYLTVFMGSLPPQVRARLNPVSALPQQLAGFRDLLETVQTQRADKRIIVT